MTVSLKTEISCEDIVKLLFWVFLSVLRSERLFYFEKLTGFSMSFLCLTSCLTLAALCRLARLPSKTRHLFSAVQSRFWDASEMRPGGPGGIQSIV